MTRNCRSRIPLSRLPIKLLLLVLLVLVTHQAYGNGWEHAAIPFEALVNALDFEVPEMRLRAAQSLGFRGQPEAVAPLLNCLAKPEKSHRVRAVIYAALGNLKDSRALPALSACLVDEAREELRSECVGALGLIGDRRSLPQILTVLETDASVLVQHSAVDALGSFSEPPAVKKLTALVKDGDNGTFRQRAMLALGRTGSTAAAEPLLLALKDSKNVSEQIVIVKALTGLRSSKAVQPLQSLLDESDDPRLRTHIVIALGAIDDGSTYPTLVAMLNDPVPSVRYFAVKSLHHQKKQEAVVPISQLSLHISRHLESHSIQELLSEPMPVLADLSFQLAAIEAIADLDAPRGLDALLTAARARIFPRDSATALKIAEGFYKKRRAAIYGLGYSKSREAANFLSDKSGIGDPDYRLRAVSARSLGVLGFSNATDILVGCLEDSSAEVRWTAAAALGRLKNTAAAGPLIERLADVNAEVRRQASLSLGFLGDPRAREQLRRIAEADENENVRTAASFSIQLLENLR